MKNHNNNFYKHLLQSVPKKRFRVSKKEFPWVWRFTRNAINRLGRTIIHDEKKKRPIRKSLRIITTNSV